MNDRIISSMVICVKCSSILAPAYNLHDMVLSKWRQFMPLVAQQPNHTQTVAAVEHSDNASQHSYLPIIQERHFPNLPAFSGRSYNTSKPLKVPHSTISTQADSDGTLILPNNHQRNSLKYNTDA